MILTGKTKIAGVIGWPVSHSRSPRLHNYWLEKYKIDGIYIPLPVDPLNLKKVLKILPKMGFAGVNLTVPHKEQALTLVDYVDPVAHRIGAVNTIIIDKDGLIEGKNTDGFGFFQNILSKKPDFNPKTGAAVVLGAGGAARAIIATLVDEGCPEIRLTNRSEKRAYKLAEEIAGPVKVFPWECRSELLDDCQLMVNSTLLGMENQPPLEISLSALPMQAIVNDIVYVPRKTALLTEAKRLGHVTVDGLGMLLHQARPGFSVWFGKNPEVTIELQKFMETL